MQATKIIGKFDRFTNSFTKYGRNKNEIMKRLEKRGFSEFRERTLNDKSQVMLAYRGSKRLADYAYRFFPDLSIEKKESGKKRAFFSRSISVQKIWKSLKDKRGNLISEYCKRMRYENDVFIEKEERFNDLVKDILIVKEEMARGENDPNLGLENIIKSYVRINGNDMYSFYQQADGTKNYIKNIDGIEYKYSSK